MEKKLNLVSKLSLNEMALRRVAINLWSDSFIFASIWRITKLDPCISRVSGDVWQRIIDRVKEKVSKLVIPNSLKERMMLLVRPVGKEILRWKLFHEHILTDVSNEEFGIDILEQLCWTCIGAIDYKKTAELLIRLEMLCIEKRYRLACFYCLEDYIPMLWMELPETYKSRFHYLSPLADNEVHLEYYWASILKGEEFKLNYILPKKFYDLSSTYSSYFKYAASGGSKAATEYFFHKLTDEERDNALFRTLCYALERTKRIFRLPLVQEKPRRDVLCYLLSLMSPEQQMKIFKQCPSSCLLFLLDWPFQDHFLHVTDLIWNFLPEGGFDYVLHRLSIITFSSVGYYFPHLFRNFFMYSPSNFRKHFVDCECLHGMLPFFYQFVRSEDAETIKVILRNLNSGDKKKLLSNPKIFHLLSCLMVLDKWHFIDLCFGKTVLSKEDREALKESYMGFRKRDCVDDDWKRLFELLDVTSTRSNSTQCSEDETLSKAKRLSSEEGKCDLTKKLKRH